MSGYAFTWLKNGGLVGAWDIKPVVGMMPEKVASAMTALGETLLGASYEPIAYLGSQVANGINHAVLAEQTMVTAEDHKNIVLMKFNEKGMECNLFAIEPVLQEGGMFGGYKINVAVGDDIPDEAMDAFNKVMKNYLGVSVTPIALLASKVVKGVSMTFAATVTPVYPNAATSVQLLTVNALTNTIDFADVL